MKRAILISSERNILENLKTAIPSRSFSENLQFSDSRSQVVTAYSYLPVTAIDVSKMEENAPVSRNKLVFFYHVMCRTIEACLAKTYSDFDAHTTSTCCHGIALLVQSLIFSINRLNLKKIQQEGQKKIEILNESSSTQEIYPCTWLVPEPLVKLARLYVLAFAKKMDPQRGILTCKTRLKLISQIGTRFCDHLVDSLQKYFSNLVALQYMRYLEEMPDNMQMHGIPIKVWGEYIKPEYLRIDKQGIYYASAMFSMQISLAQLIFSRAKIAIINDVIEETGQVKKGRLVYLFEGNGCNQMTPLTRLDINDLQSNSKEPIIVFGGCVCFENAEEEKAMYRMQPWQNQIPSLILACDIWYPQFPRVVGDIGFDDTPIIPYEACLNDVIAKHSKVTGVSTNDPSLFCLTHVYTASICQVLSLLNESDKTRLPISFIPSAKIAAISI